MKLDAVLGLADAQCKLFFNWILRHIRFVLIFLAFTNVVALISDPGPVVTPVAAGLAIFWVLLSLWVSDDLSV